MSAPTVDTKLMDNYISSTLPNVTSFGACYDEEYYPMLFYVDSVDNDLHFVYRDPVTGQNNLPVNISAAIGSTGSAQHVAISQNAQGYATLAAGFSNGTGGTDIALFKPALPGDIKKDIKSLMLQSPKDSSSLNVSSIVMTNSASNDVYPHIALVLSASDQQTIQQISVDMAGGSWNWDANWQLPDSPTQILDQAWSIIEGSPGMWVLTSDNTATSPIYSLNAYTLVLGGMCTRIATPPEGLSNASRLSTVINAEGKEDLLLFGNGLNHYRAADFTSDGANPSLLSNDSLFNFVNQASVSQNGDNVRVWFQSNASAKDISNGNMCYVSLSTGDLTSENQTATTLQPIPLTSKHLQGMYVSLTSAADDNYHVQHFMFIDEDKNFQVASQSLSGTWNKTLNQFSFPNPERIIALQTYTTSISYNDPVGETSVHHITITSDDTASLIINGSKSLISPTQPITVDVQPNGKLFFIHEAGNLIVPKLTVTDGSSGTPVIIDPVQDTQTQLTQYNTDQKLNGKVVPNENGGTTPLVDPKIGVDARQLAASRINSLSLRADEINSSNAAKQSLAMESSFETDGFADFVDNAWDWIEEQGSDAIQWIDQEGESMKNFAIQIGDKLVQIAIDKIQDVVRVAKIVFDALKVGWDILKALVGALFEWKTIMAAQQAISKNLTDAVAYMQSVADVAIPGMSSWFDTQIQGLEDKLESAFDVWSQGDSGNLFSSISNGSAGQDDVSGLGTSAKGSLLQHALSHGNTANTQDSWAIPTSDNLDSLMNTIDSTTQKWLTSDVSSRLQAIANDFVQIMTSSSSNKPSIQPLIQLIKNVIDILLDLLRLVFEETFSVIELCADVVFSTLTAPIEIPIIGPLLQFVATNFFHVDIQFPSLIDIGAFFLAIIKVEMQDVAGISIDTNLVSLFPKLTDTTMAVKSFLGEKQSEIRSNDLSQAQEMSDGWKAYSLTSAWAHPTTLGVKAVLSIPSNAIQFAKAMGAGNMVKVLYEMPISIIEKLEMFLIAADVAFSVPAFNEADRENLVPEFAGYAISSVAMIIQGILHLAKVESGLKWWETAACIFNLTKSVLYSISINSQLEAAASDPDTKEDVQKAIGNLVCSTTASVATWMLTVLGPLMVDGNPEAGFGVSVAGALVNTLAEFADFGVDLDRGVHELQATQNKGQYNGMKR